MIIVGMAAARRRMRQHQGIPPPRPRLPLWRLLLGEAVWALQELGRRPAVLAALLVGAGAALAVLGGAAPGPVLPWPGRIVVGLLVGLVVARGVAAWDRRRAGGHDPDHDPAVAATEVVGALTAAVLLGWLVVWLVSLVMG